MNIDDLEQVKTLCATVWDGNDYVPAIFPKWVENPLARTMGLFEADELVAVANIEKISETDIAWVQGLRVKESHRERGYATRITHRLIEIAKDFGVRHLWYATSSRNQSSMRVAEKCGFRQADKTGYFRLYKPYPPHPRPSLNIVPLKANPERLYELLIANPALVESSTFPLAWHFDFKTKDGLARLMENALVKVVVDKTGVAQGIYCYTERERNEEKTAAFTVFSTDRSVFVDIMSRMIEQADSSGADRAVFFLGPRVSEWSLDLGYVADEFIDRRFLLYELNPAEF
ncbi:MAG: GNAT family N-acetyltransferase [Candidatus Thorarchaeota archaeon]